MKKFKLANLKKLVPQSKVTKQKPPASRLAARLTQPAYDDYEEEPTTKLSTAFVVVFVLHLVAIGGIYAFHNIKAKRREADGTAVTAGANAQKEAAQKEGAQKVESAAKTPPAPVQSVSGTGQPAAVAAAFVAGAAAAKVATTPTVEKAPAGPSALVPQPVKPAANGAAQAHPGTGPTAKPAGAGAAPQAQSQPGDAGARTYTVKKGDNPVQIAKRMGVNYDDLLKINGVQDPKRLRIGQVLKLPVRTKTPGN
jgi:LysM repeat protein